jgi:hypothetical protein
LLSPSAAFVFVFLLINLSSRRGCGNCGKLGRSFPEFSKRGGNGGKHAVRFPRFPRRGSFHNLQSPTNFFAGNAKKRGPYLTLNEFLSKGV